jgi:hypothetical protein
MIAEVIGECPNKEFLLSGEKSKVTLCSLILIEIL